ncbi:MAG: DUF1622 domain-containing protein [Anaerolineae bacterium]|nr:DUF1622 domain-containing protein [Anaerolineae bacterium]
MDCATIEECLRLIVSYFVIIVETFGALIIMFEVIKSFVLYMARFFGNKHWSIQDIRFQLGEGMVMGLEFQVAADILKTALSPNWNDILLLSALIAIRTLVNYLMERELDALGAACDPSLHNTTLPLSVESSTANMGKSPQP